MSRLLVFCLAALAILSGSAAPDLRVRYVDVTEQSGIRFRHENGGSPGKLMVETFGSGVAWLDFDSDSFLDLYLVNGSNLAAGSPSPGNVLLRNTGKGTFVDVTRQARVGGTGGYGTGVAVADFDNDGLADLFVTYFGPNVLYRNNGDGTFADVTARAGVSGNFWSSSAGFFDYDRDGDLDLYVATYLEYDDKKNPYCGFQKPGYRMYCAPTAFDGTPDQLYRNNGNGTFTDISEKAGVANPAGKGLGVVFADVDDDGYPDIYVANDLVRNFLYHNRGDGTFDDVTYSAGVGFDLNGKPQAGMGVDAGDFDGDGRLDLFVTNFSDELNTMYRNLGGLLFEDITEKVGLESGRTPLGFGTKLFDFDNDGDVDIYVTNGHVIDNIQLYNPRFTYAQRDLLYENAGGRFRDVSTTGGPGLQVEKVGRGAAVADFDNDGDLDIVVSSCGRPAVLLRNDGGNRNRWIALLPQGKRSNRSGFGARVRLTTSQGTQVKEVTPVASYLSSNDPRLYFGLGSDAKVRRIEIRWPSGREQVLTDVPADQLLTVREPD
ncbi:MAG: CRTAC1 family protein [Acidobacteriota bacterium]